MSLIDKIFRKSLILIFRKSKKIFDMWSQISLFMHNDNVVHLTFIASKTTYRNIFFIARTYCAKSNADKHKIWDRINYVYRTALF